ncbi:MAG: glycosyltransferase family 2 protein [Syntrophobacterales bacterium]|jgi:GT2 family glycosyltransferase
MAAEYNSTNPLISIIVPVHNGAETVERTLDTLLAQTYKNKEIIVIDDYSTDDSRAILKKYDGKVQLHFNEQNLGLARNYNKAIGLAAGSIIMLAHHDCSFPDQEYLQKMLKNFTDEDVGAVTGRLTIPDFKNLDLGKRLFITLNLCELDPAPNDGPVELGFIEGKCDAFRREVLEDVGYFSTEISMASEDHEISIRIRERGYRLVLDPALEVVLDFGGNQDTYGKVLKKQFIYGRGQAYTAYHHGLKDCANIDKNMNRMLRAIHRLSQLSFVVLYVFLGGASLLYKGGLGFLFPVVGVRLGYYLLLSFFYQVSIAPLVVFSGFLSDFFYTAGYARGLLLSAQGRRV